MRYHSQNLTGDYLDHKERSMLLAGRAWLYARPEDHCELSHWEWALGPYARGFAAWISLGYGENERGICLHLCLPFLFSLYLIWNHGPKVQWESKTGLAIHNGSFWLYPFVNENESRSGDPWWKRNHAWDFPWTLAWHKTEILSHHELERVVWSKDKRNRNPFLTCWDNRQEAEKQVSREYPYTYKLKSGEVQQRTATVHVDRMEWRARWYPLIPIKKIRTSINITFNEEVGEGTGSWKGGCTGCGYEMLPGETPEQTLRRMERERVFSR